jgi:hypothetical protein
MLCCLLLNHINETQCGEFFSTLFQVKQEKCFNYTVFSFNANHLHMQVFLSVVYEFLLFLYCQNFTNIKQDKSVEML